MRKVTIMTILWFIVISFVIVLSTSQTFFGAQTIWSVPKVTDIKTVKISALPPAGTYSKEELLVTLMSDIPSDIHYALDGETPFIDSPIYSGQAVPVYQSGKKTTILSAIAVDSSLNESNVAKFIYTFVPPKPESLRAKPLSDGRVELLWQPSQDPDVQEYRIYVDDLLYGSAKTYTAFTVSGLSLTEHTFAVTAVDNMESESLRSEVTATPLILPRNDEHSASPEEISPLDLNQDGAVDAHDVEILLKNIKPSLDILDVFIRWFHIKN